MAIGAGLEMRQGQSLVMTTQLQQSIKILQLSSVELTEYLASEMEQNPLLTSDDGDKDSAPEEKKSQTEETADTQEDLVEFSENHQTWDEEAAGSLDAPQDSVWQESDDGGFKQTVGESGKGNAPAAGEFNEFENTLSEQVSLQDHLRTQLQSEIHDPIQRIIGLHLIDLVDERGYVPEDLTGVSDSLSCDLDEVEAVLILMQSFEPSGVFARNLPECLSIQLKERDRLDPAMARLLENLDILATGDMKRLMKLCDVDEEDIALMLEEIRELNPKPGYAYGSETVQSVIPDVYLRRTAEKGWHVELNADALPKVLINRQYYSKISVSARQKEDKKYLSEQLAHANWLTKTLDQRAQTILTVTTEIVKQQDEFFRFGVRYFKPLILRDIAEVVDLHESTISRVTTQKYLSTGNAIYELKYFFSSALSSKDGRGDSHSSESVKDIIRELIEGEDPKAILSDDAIAAKLKEEGIEIARRTVAKYREAMGFGSSAARRREKKSLLD